MEVLPVIPKRFKLARGPDQTPFFIPDLEFSFDNSLLSQESGLLPVLAGDTQDWYAVFWYYNEPATSQS